MYVIRQDASVIILIVGSQKNGAFWKSLLQYGISALNYCFAAIVAQISGSDYQYSWVIFSHNVLISVKCSR